MAVISSDQLSKVWKIGLDSAKRTLGVTTQRCKRSDDLTLSRNYSTNDWILRYKRIGKFSSWIPSLLNPKGGKLLRGNTCWHLFVSYKCFVFVVPMKSKYWVPLDLKLFAKEIGDPDAIICDADGKEKSKEVRKFRHHIGTTLRCLEESTPWANLSEMYICLIKESIRKDMKSCNRP